MGKSATLVWGLRLFLATILCVSAGVAEAAPPNGFGFYVGPVSSHDGELYGNGHGAGVGVDAQFAVNDRWSLNPYLFLSSESADQSYDVQNGEGGLQARYWVGSWFVAGQFLFHDMLLTQRGHVSSSLYGPGVGAAVGWESDTHWSVTLVANGLEYAHPPNGTTSYRSDLLLLVGYRWY